MSGSLYDLMKAPPIARHNDPETSHAAAEEITKSGARGRQAMEVLEALRQHPSSTSAELAEASGIDRYVTARRLPELEKAGFVARSLIRPCKATGRKALTWVVK